MAEKTKADLWEEAMWYLEMSHLDEANKSLHRRVLRDHPDYLPGFIIRMKSLFEKGKL